MKAKGYQGPDSQRVQQVFAGIAHRYDFLNHFLSAGIDKHWRKQAVKILASSHPENILDVASGKELRRIGIREYMRTQQILWGPDGKHVVTGGFEGKVRIFDVESGNLEKEFVPVTVTPTVAAN
jgi:ubiquinone/menaquinone biosynthesis C-methylase UbiE